MTATVDSIVRNPIGHRLTRICACILLSVTAAFGAQPTAASSYPDPAEMVRKAVQNELKAAKDDTARFMFRGVKKTSKGSTTRLYVETRDATAGLATAYNGRPLTPTQQTEEGARVQRFIDDPDELNKKREHEREYAEHTMRIVRALPNAFLFEYAGEEPGSDGVGRSGATLVKLKFRPKPDYEPPSRVEEVLTGMEGYVLVDPVRYRLASIDGTLFKEVGFGWGILGHLDAGSRFVVRQQEASDNFWEVSEMTLRFTGKILLFKNLSINSSEIFTGFKRVPADLTFAQAIELLKKEEGVEPQSSSESKPADPQSR
jgi:hypothetical protein